MFKKSIFCLCVFFVVPILIVNSAFALNLGFHPSTQTVIQGDYAIVDIAIDLSGFGFLSGYDLSIEYDPFILEIKYDDISVSSTLGELAVYDLDVNVDPNFGTIHISWMSDYCSDEVFEQPTFLNLATLNFLTLDEGVSDLQFSSICLYNDLLNPSVNLDLGNPDDIDDLAAKTTNGEINVSACPPPAPDPEPNALPEPSTLFLLGISSLIGLGYFKRKKVS